MRPSLSRAILLLAGLALAACSSTPVAPPASPPPVAEAAPASAAVAAPPQASEPEADASLSIYFMLASSSLHQDEKEKLRAHAARLKEDPDLHVTLVGHSDNAGSRAYNLALTDQRVNAVARYLRQLGVPLRQIGKGFAPREQTPATCKTSACLQKMRRVELVFAPAP